MIYFLLKSLNKLQLAPSNSGIKNLIFSSLKRAHLVKIRKIPAFLIKSLSELKTILNKIFKLLESLPWKMRAQSYPNPIETLIKALSSLTR